MLKGEPFFGNFLNTEIIFIACVLLKQVGLIFYYSYTQFIY